MSPGLIFILDNNNYDNAGKKQQCIIQTFPLSEWLVISSSMSLSDSSSYLSLSKLLSLSRKDDISDDLDWNESKELSVVSWDNGEEFKALLFKSSETEGL